MSVKAYYVAPVYLYCEENPVTVGDQKDICEMPYDGEILGDVGGPKITGQIEAAGSGAAGVTSVQIRNVSTGYDYFSTLPAFEEADKDANGRALLTPGRLKARNSFRAGDRIAVDVDEIPGGSDSGAFWVRIECGFWREEQ